MTNFQDIFFYYGCCGMISLATLYLPWHNTASMVWFTVSILKFNDYPYIIGIMGLIIGFMHLKYGYDHDKKMKIEKNIRNWFTNQIPMEA